MKTTRFLTLMAATLMMALSACKQDPLNHFTDNVKVTTAEPSFITGTTASCGAEVTADDEGLLLELGICWSETENPTTSNYTLSTPKCSQPYSCLLTQLDPETKYYLRAYAKYGTEYVYGEEKTFTTLSSDTPAISPVTTLEATEITYWTFMAGAKVEPFGTSLFSVGVCYGTQDNLTKENCDGYDFGYLNDESGVYEVYCDELRPNTQYFYRAFVAYDGGSGVYDNYFYGEILSFTTPEIPFILELETQNVFYSMLDYIVAYGRMQCNEPEVINQVGFCYSTDNEYPQYESDLHTTVASPTGEWYEFNSHIYNVSANQKYYVRSYARYKTDSIKYGNVVSVTTY